MNKCFIYFLQEHEGSADINLKYKTVTNKVTCELELFKISYLFIFSQSTVSFDLVYDMNI